MNHNNSLQFVKVGQTVKVGDNIYRCIKDEGFSCSRCDFNNSDGCFEYSCAKQKRKDRIDVVYVLERRLAMD